MSGFNSDTAAAADLGVITPRAVDGGQGWNWIAQGWDLFAKNPGIWIVNFILLVIISMALGLVPVLGHIANQLLYPVLIAGLMLGCRALQRGEPFEVAHLFAGFQTNTAQLVMLGLFTLIAWVLILAVVLGLLFVLGGGAIISAIVGGSVAGAVAGAAIMLMLLGLLVMMLLFIPVAMAVWFAPCLIVFHNLQAIDAMKLSFDACMKNMVPFLIYGLVMFIFCILATIPLGLGWLVLAPVGIATIYTGYRDIFSEA
jgi:uncharacterized membrane protein